jgi:hypothetical protein
MARVREVGAALRSTVWPTRTIRRGILTSRPPPKLPDVDSPPPEDVLDEVPPKEEVVKRARPADEIVEEQPSVEELLDRDR